MLYMDCANGVGAPKMAALTEALQAAGAPLAVSLHNTGEGVLNGGCGSDFLQKDRQLPHGYADVPPGARCCAVDGDADRLMYFTPLADGSGKGACLARSQASSGSEAAYSSIRPEASMRLPVMSSFAMHSPPCRSPFV
jgi:phosphoacetylglucosamine mutase